MQSEVRMLPTDKDIEDNLYKYEIDPFIVTRNGEQISILTENTTINCLNKYCSKLMRSKFFSLVPVWILYKNKSSVNGLYQVFCLQVLYVFYLILKFS